jgi:cysteine synthase A
MEAQVTHEVDPQVINRFKAVARLVGNTPMLAIDFVFRGEPRTIYAKAEHYNLTGSIKDRMALHILRRAYEDGSIKPGDRIVEATSGNTGIAFSAIGRALGHPVSILLPDWMSRERVDIIRSLGAQVIPVSRAQGGFVGSIAISEQMAADDPRVFLPRQFANQANVEAHRTSTGPEILAQMRANGLEPDGFIAGVGTGGTVMGAGGYLKHEVPSVKIHPLEPAESPTLSTGHKTGAHRIQGISDDFIPAIVDLGALDEVIGVSDGDAILMAQRLASQLGIAVGISSGANFIGALMVQNTLGADARVVTIFSDSNKKYLTTDLLRDEPVKPDYLSTEVELVGFRAFSRVCDFCGDLADPALRIRMEPM